MFTGWPWNVRFWSFSQTFLLGDHETWFTWILEECSGICKSWAPGIKISGIVLSPKAEIAKNSSLWPFLKTCWLCNHETCLTCISEVPSGICKHVTTFSNSFYCVTMQLGLHAYRMCFQVSANRSCLGPYFRDLFYPEDDENNSSFIYFAIDFHRIHMKLIF